MRQQRVWDIVRTKANKFNVCNGRNNNKDEMEMEMYGKKEEPSN
jgi:hypothetical protein